MNNQTINEINKRDLDKVFFSFTILSQDIFFNYGNDYIKKRTIYTIIGCNINGVRKYITSFFADEYDKTSDWYNLLLSLKERGLQHIFFVICSNNKTIKNAFDLVFKNITYFYLNFNIISKLYHYTSSSYSTNILVYLKKLYLSNDIDEFNLIKTAFFDDYASSPFIIDIISNDINDFTPFLKYPLFLRKHVISFYFFRELIKSLSVAAHSQSSFYKITEYEEKLISNIKTFETRMYCSKKEWNEIISYLYKDHKDLLLCVL